MADAGEIKNINIDAVRSVMQKKRIMSKNELARETGLSFPTVSRTVELLTAAGELEEKGPSGSTGGRCAQLYSINPLYKVTLCLRLETKELNWFVSDLLGGHLESGMEQCTEGAVQTIDKLILRLQVRYPQLGAVVMGLSGTVHKGTVTESFGCDELRGVDLSTHLKNISKLPCTVEGDMHAVSAGYWSRCSHPPKAAACIYMSKSCIGSGIVIEGNAWHGASEFAGELHYLPIENNMEYARTNFAGADMAEYYAKIIRSYAALLNPDRIVLYGNDFIAGKTDEIRRICAQNLPTHAIPQIEVSNEFNEDYEQGLYVLANHLLDR